MIDSIHQESYRAEENASAEMCNNTPQLHRTMSDDYQNELYNSEKSMKVEFARTTTYVHFAEENLVSYLSHIDTFTAAPSGQARTSLANQGGLLWTAIYQYVYNTYRYLRAAREYQKMSRQHREALGYTAEDDIHQPAASGE